MTTEAVRQDVFDAISDAFSGILPGVPYNHAVKAVTDSTEAVLALPEISRGLKAIEVLSEYLAASDEADAFLDEFGVLSDCQRLAASIVALRASGVSE